MNAKIAKFSEMESVLSVKSDIKDGIITININGKMKSTLQQGILYIMS